MFEKYKISTKVFLTELILNLSSFSLFIEESTSNSSDIKTERLSPLLNCSAVSNQNYQQIR